MSHESSDSSNVNVSVTLPPPAPEPPPETPQVPAIVIVETPPPSPPMVTPEVSTLEEIRNRLTSMENQLQALMETVGNLEILETEEVMEETPEPPPLNLPSGEGDTLTTASVQSIEVQEIKAEPKRKKKTGMLSSLLLGR